MTAVDLVQRPKKRKQIRPKHFEQNVKGNISIPSARTALGGLTVAIAKQSTKSNLTILGRPNQQQTNTTTTATTTTTTTATSFLPKGKLCQQFVLFVVSWCLLLILAPSVTTADWLMECGNCHCKWNSGKKTADCKNLTLATVPGNLSPDVQVLDLSHNRISCLEPNAFRRAQLHNLHKLYIRNASIVKIDPRSFTQLEILIELDLSNNQLRALQANQFGHLVKVRALLLNNNQLEMLGNGIFQNLNYLHRLEMKSNRLTRIATQVFVNLPMLSQIYLDENRLNFLRKDSFEHLKRLTALSLDQNPWNCTCELQIFRDFVLERNLYTPPTACHFPAHLRGMLWIEDQPEAFACKPKIIYPAKGASINTSKENVTLICRVHASPTTHITWNHNKQLIRVNIAAYSGDGSGIEIGGSGESGSRRQQQRIQIQLVHDENNAKEKGNTNSTVGSGAGFGSSRNIIISRLTIVSADKTDEGIYTCSAENAGGKDSVQMSLFVHNASTTMNDFWLIRGNLVIVIALLALGLLSISFFVTMATCCIYKRLKLYNGLTPHHDQHNHPRHHHRHLDTQLTPSTGNVLVESTSVDAGKSCESGRGSMGNSSGIITADENVEAVKTTCTGNYHHLVKEYANVNSNKIAKNFANHLLQEDSSYIITNANTVLANPTNTAPPPRHFYKDGMYFPHSYELSLDDGKQIWTKSNINKDRSLKDNEEKDGTVALRKVCQRAGGGGDFQPDLVSAYNNSKANS